MEFEPISLKDSALEIPISMQIFIMHPLGVRTHAK